MWRTGSSFDGEEFRLSDPALYRLLDQQDEGITELAMSEKPPAPRRRGRPPAAVYSERERWRE